MTWKPDPAGNALIQSEPSQRTVPPPHEVSAAHEDGVTVKESSVVVTLSSRVTDDERRVVSWLTRIAEKVVWSVETELEAAA